MILIRQFLFPLSKQSRSSQLLIDSFILIRQPICCLKTSALIENDKSNLSEDFLKFPEHITDLNEALINPLTG